MDTELVRWVSFPHLLHSLWGVPQAGYIMALMSHSTPSKSNKLTLSTEKTFFIIYHTKRKQIHPQYDNLQINSSVIKRVTHVKYLGVFLDEHLSWDIHITYLCYSLAKYLSVFCNVRMMVPEKLKKQLYYSFVYSRIAYGIEVYGSCNTTLLAKVQVMQNKLLMILYNKDRRYSTNTLHHELKLLQVKDITNFCS